MPPGVLDFFRTFRLVDFLDIVVIAIFLYLILNWLQKSASRRAIISLSILLLLYLMARATEMYLTEILIEGLFVVILIGIVVVFQSDIRRLIDRIGNWNFFWESRTSAAESQVMDVLTEASARLAESNTGALIVLKGNEDIRRHITGGIELQGNVSLPLLLSIFETNSPGHDGALILDDGRISKFGAHLPLSTNLDKITKGGTRHAAALGLSERCDALVVVISEERGVISVARYGRLIELEANSDLKSHLSRFWKEHYQKTETDLKRWWHMRSPRAALVSFIIAILLWFSLAYNTETVYRTYYVPIEYRNLQSSSIVLEDSVPIETRVTLMGSEQAFRQFDASDLVVSFNLDSSNHFDSQELLITEDNINLPADLTLYDVNPQTLKVKARRLVTARVPVVPAMQGTLDSQLELVSMQISPDSVSIVAPEGNVPDTLATEPVNLDEISGSAKLIQQLILPEDVRIPEDSVKEVSVVLRVQKNCNNNF